MLTEETLIPEAQIPGATTSQAPVLSAWADVLLFLGFPATVTSTTTVTSSFSWCQSASEVFEPLWHQILFYPSCGMFACFELHLRRAVDYKICAVKIQTSILFV